MHTSNSLKITFLNVCGIKSKLLNPDVHVLIQYYDILVFVETKLDNFDVLQLPVGYTYHVKNRTNCDRKSGDIIVIYKQALAKHIKFLNSNSEFVLWFEIIKFCQYRIKYYLGVLIFRQKIRGIPLIMLSMN